MSRRRLLVVAAVVAGLAALAAVQIGRTASTDAAPCQLGTGATGPIQHVIYLQFDNTHSARDSANVPSDLEQMPHLKSFLENGTLFTNDHTILISHTAGGILSSLTGLYPDRMGQTVSNSYDYYPPSKVPAFTSSFKYWTAPVDPVNDTLPNMITDTGKTTPAPWVPFTRAGCDVGGVGTANIELENASTSPTGDITKVFGQGSPEWNEAAGNSQLGQTDFVGIAIHCSQASTSSCAGNANAKPDQLPDEPGGYAGFNALYGTKYVDPAITSGKPCVNDTSGNPVTDPLGNCGFPGFDGMLAANTLGYVAAMQEAGVQVTYGYISDAHDLHVPTLATDAYSSSATGPGELQHNLQLKAYDDAFVAFFKDLRQHGITPQNTLFAITVDEGDHFAGGPGNPQSGGNWLIYDHRTCTNLSNCPTNQIGEVTANMNALLPAADQNVTGTTPKYDIHFDDAPTFYLTGQPGRTDPTVRKYERDVAGLTSLDPYVRDSGGHVQTVPLTAGLVDTVGEKALHMVNADPNRTPTFTMFGNPDFFFQTTNPCTNVAECVTGAFAWNHGDIQDEIGQTWVGFVGPGIRGNGVDPTTWTDHTNVRPTILSLLGLKDDYVSDGRVLVEGLNFAATPKTLSGQSVRNLMNAYAQVNASFGDFSKYTVVASTKALSTTDETRYASIEDSIASLTSQRDALASNIRAALNDAAFSGTSISTAQAQTWTDQANSLIAQMKTLSES